MFLPDSPADCTVVDVLPFALQSKDDVGIKHVPGVGQSGELLRVWVPSSKECGQCPQSPVICRTEQIHV